MIALFFTLILLFLGQGYSFTYSRTQTLRLLQDNPSNPTGPNMGTVPGIVPLQLEALTPAIVNRIAEQTGKSTAGNYQLIGPTTSQNVSIPLPQPPNISIQISGTGVINNLSWVSTTVELLQRDPNWISARGLLSRLNISYFSENQIINLLKQPNSFNTYFNITFVSVRGYIEAVVSVSPNLMSSLASIKYINSSSTAVNTSSQQYLIIQSLLRNIFYDFTKSPLTLLNGTITTVSNLPPIIYNLNYNSSAGVYGFTIKVLNQKIYIMGCNLITVKVDTQTVPVIATINLLNVDGNFQYINNIIIQYLRQNQINLNPVFQKVIIWTNRGGNQLVYYLTTQLGSSNIDIGVLFNLTSRSFNIAYVRNNTLFGIITTPINTNTFNEVSFISQVHNQTFLAIDLAARSRFPGSVVGPITKIQTKVGVKGSDYRLTYQGNGRQVSVVYQQQ